MHELIKMWLQWLWKVLKASSSSSDKREKSGYDELPKEMHELKIRDDKCNNHQSDVKDMEPAVVTGKGIETGQIIVTTIGGQNRQEKQMLSYLAKRVVGTSSFGVAFQPVFPGESGVDQLVEITKTLGTPTGEEIKCMNPNYTEFKSTQIKGHPWQKVFHKRMPAKAVDLVSRLLQYSPNLRFTALALVLEESSLSLLLVIYFVTLMVKWFVLQAATRLIFDGG